MVLITTIGIAFADIKAKSSDGKISIHCYSDTSNVVTTGFGWNYNNYPVYVSCTLYYANGDARDSYFTLSANARGNKDGSVIAFSQASAPFLSGTTGEEAHITDVVITGYCERN